MIKVLMVGYNGANNTGAEALLLSDIADVRAVLGPEARITVPTLSESNLRRYLRESETLRIAPIPTLYFGAIRRLVREHDLVLLVEGSTYMDSWGSPLLWAFLWAGHCATEMGKPCLAYAVDAGTLRPANLRRVRSVASRADLIITRNTAAAERLREYGVTAPIRSTADNAFTFLPTASGGQGASNTVGIALVDFSLWPVRARLWGRRSDCYKWPYYFSRSRARRAQARALVRGYAELADRVVERTGFDVALICMEEVDERLAREVRTRMWRHASVRIVSARKHDAVEMTALLRSLRLLITSRFHAAVLSLAAAVPQVAVGHDTRLATLYRDLGLSGDWFLEPGSPALFEELETRVFRLLDQPGLQEKTLRTGHTRMLSRARQNRALLAEFVNGRFVTNGGVEWVA